METNREELLELVLEAVAGYKDMDLGEIRLTDAFADLELEPMDVMSIVREVCLQGELDPPKGCEFAQTVGELVDYLCE